MGIAIDNARYYAIGTSNSSLTFTLAANAILFAFVDFTGGGAAFSAMDIGGTPMGSIAATNTANLFAWCATAPPAGVQTFNFHLTGNFQHGVALVSYTGHATSGPLGTGHPQSSGTASTFNISVSSTTTDVVIFAVRAQGATNAVTINNGNTRLSGTSSGLTRLVIADITGASSITLSATVATAATSWDSVAVPLHIAATVASVPWMALMGVGQ